MIIDIYAYDVSRYVVVKVAALQDLEAQSWEHGAGEDFDSRSTIEAEPIRSDMIINCAHWSACVRILDRESAEMTAAAELMARLGCGHCPQAEEGEGAE